MKGLGVFICLLLLGACGSGGGSSSLPVSKVTITSPPLAVQIKSAAQFTATETDTSGKLISPPSISWSVDGGIGTINSAGVYTAPSMIPSLNPVTIRATASSDSTKSDAVPLYVLTGPILNFGTTVDESKTLPNQTGPSKFQVAVFNQKVYVTWVTTSQTLGTELLYSKGDMNGNFSTPHNILSDISSYGASFNPGHPVIMLDNKIDPSSGDPGVYIAWDDNGASANYQILGVKGLHSTSPSCPYPCFTPFALTGTGNATSLQIDPGSTNQQNPAMAFNPLGKLEFAWTQTYSGTFQGTYITYKELKSDGSLLTSSIPLANSVSPNNQTNPQIGVDKTGTVSVSWIDYGGQNPNPPNVYYSRRVAGQQRFGSPIPVETAPLVPSDTLSMTLDDNGQPYLAWSNSNPINMTGGYYSTTSNFVNFSTPVKLTSRGNGNNPTLKVDLLKYLYFTCDDGSSLYFTKWNSTSIPSTFNFSLFTGVNPGMDIGIDGRAYLLYSSIGSSNLSTYFIKGE